MVSKEFLSYAMAVALLAVALLIYLRSQREAFIEKVSRRMAESSGIKSEILLHHEQHAAPMIEHLFWRAGIDVSSWQLSIGFLCLIFLAILGGLWKGFGFGLSVPVIGVAVIYLWLLRQAKKRIVLILAQLPLFLDQVLRGLGTGRSMEGALRLAAEETPVPLKEIIDRVLRANELGADLGETIQETADLYRINELYLLALAIRINRTYGSSVRDLLQNVVKMIHDREAARRELRALTGETRVTAWVLGLLPPGMAVYIMAMNPKYLESMWQDPSGQVMLVIAVVLQIAGAFVLWRMIKSI
ncbi:MAG: type II secretion system F family protein [Methylobacter sp.]|uniref:type II secretion system F family protein n=1 Tax=Methylobacter sp. TaxID=2051955 RepID=UPI0025866B3D|nr:type II secretion system F family protein [Methylobacter sp.]MCL7421805.1 type II secretion system F family protein [Methylobacter sp.]